MATESGLARLELRGEMQGASPKAGALTALLSNATQGRRWDSDSDTAEADTVYRATLSLSASGAQTLNLLAAGSLADLLGGTVDLDEIKALAIKCTAGEFTVAGAVSNPLGVFTGSGEGLQLKATGGCSFAAFDFGAAGLDVTTNSQITLTETSTSAGATAEVMVIGNS